MQLRLFKNPQLTVEDRRSVFNSLDGETKARAHYFADQRGWTVE